jgi:hypothetical protein
LEEKARAVNLPGMVRETPGSGKDYLLRLLAFFAFALPTTFLALVAEKTIHEVVGHGVTAWAVGGEFSGFKVCLFGKSYAYAFAAPHGTVSDRVLISAGGIVSGLLFGLLCLLPALKGREHPFLRLGCAILSAVSLIEATSYAFWGAYRPEGEADVATILGLLDREWLRWILLFTSGAAFVGFTALLSALFFRHLESWLGGGLSLAGWRRVATVATLGGIGAAGWWINDWGDEEAFHFMRFFGSVVQLGSALVLYRWSLPVPANALALRAALVPSAVSWGLALTVVITIAALTVPAWAPPPEPPPLPVPNGHDDLVRAGELCQWDFGFDEETAAIDELRGVIERNQEAIAVARAGLSRECRVPIECSGRGQELLFEGLSGFRALGHALVAAGRLAEREGDLKGAAECAKDVVRLGVESGRGGMVVNWLVTGALQEVGIGQVHRIGQKLGQSEARDLLASLVSLQTRRQSLEEAKAIEKRYYPVIAQWTRREELVCGCVSFDWEYSGSEFEFRGEDREKRCLALWRLLLTELAIRSFEARTGRTPDSLAALVPADLDSVPQDPFADGAALVYRPAAGGYALYSVGQNRKDDGGREPRSTEAKPADGDLSLDGLLRRD